MSATLAAFLLVDEAMKLPALPVVIKSAEEVRLDGAGMARGLGAPLRISTLYLTPQTAAIGAILLTFLPRRLSNHVGVSICAMHAFVLVAPHQAIRCVVRPRRA